MGSQRIGHDWKWLSMQAQTFNSLHQDTSILRYTYSREHSHVKLTRNCLLFFISAYLPVVFFLSTDWGVPWGVFTDEDLGTGRDSFAEQRKGQSNQGRWLGRSEANWKAEERGSQLSTGVVGRGWRSVAGSQPLNFPILLEGRAHSSFQTRNKLL